MGLVDRVLAGDIGALARVATHIENDTDLGRTALERLYSHSGRAHVVGITGAPGAGKSTLINSLTKRVRSRGRTIGVVAIDPTSPLTSGAALGDRIRMLESWSDPGVFIRSMASRGRRGGLAPSTAGIVHLLDAAGFDLIVVETVGVGQEEIDVAAHVHTVVLLQVPGLGDDVQTIKAGVLEVADIYVVNKADRPGGDDVARQLRALVGPLGRHDPSAWSPPILKCDSTTGQGIEGLLHSIDVHREHLRNGSGWKTRTETMARGEIRARLWQAVSRQIESATHLEADSDRLVQDVAGRTITPLAAAEQLLSRSFGDRHTA